MVCRRWDRNKDIVSRHICIAMLETSTQKDIAALRQHRQNTITTRYNNYPNGIDAHRQIIYYGQPHLSKVHFFTTPHYRLTAALFGETTHVM